MADNNFLQINGKSFPYPARDGLKITCTTFVDSGRNANATVVGEVIGREQYKIECTWRGLSGETWAEMCTEFAKFFVTVKMYIPTTNSIQEIEMYVGDRTAVPYFLDDNNELVKFYKECKCNLIDVGVQ